MAGRPAYGADYYEDVCELRRRRLSAAQIAQQLGIGRATVYRLIKRHEEEATTH